MAHGLALVAAHFGAVMGVLTAAAAMRVLDPRPASESTLYSLHLATGVMGYAQRTLLGFWRAALALVAARLVLNVFDTRLDQLFTALILVWLLAWDVGLFLATKNPDVRARGRRAIPLSFAASIAAAWLVTRS